VKSKDCKTYFSVSDVEEPFMTENSIMWNYLKPELKKRKEEIEVDRSFAAKVRTILFELIPSGNRNNETVERKMALCKNVAKKTVRRENNFYAVA